MPVTIKQVAKLAGVSTSTVSHVLNGTHYVSPELTQRVLDAVDELDYELNPVARVLAGGRSNLIGVLIPDLYNSFCTEILRGIDDELFARQYDVLMYTNRNNRQTTASYASTFTSGLVAGLVIIVPHQIDNYLKQLQRKNIPYVMIDHQGIGNTDYLIESTNWQGAFDATCYLIEIGHRRVGFITGSHYLRCTHDRLAGYKSALADCGISLDPALIVEGGFQAEPAIMAIRRLLELPERPTAVFASNDTTAMAVIEDLQRHGLSVPDDISVIGFDDIPEAASFPVPLTTVRQPLIKMGRSAAQILVERVDNPDLPVAHIQLDTELIIRASTQPLPSS